MLQSEKSSELFYIHLSILSRAYCTQLYLWLSSQRQYKSQKSVQLGSVLNVCRFQQLSKYYQVKRRGINRLSVTSSAELNWIHIKECNRFSTLNNLYCCTNLSNTCLDIYSFLKWNIFWGDCIKKFHKVVWKFVVIKFHYCQETESLSWWVSYH